MAMEGMDMAVVTIMDMAMVDMAGTEGMAMEVMAAMVGDTDMATDMGTVTHHMDMVTPLTDMVTTIPPMDTVMEALDISIRGAWVRLSRCT